ncbi:TPR repeat protein [Candidatus Thiomargarita nelsonii]|uniref:TPR repeat protein n=1 Tax=Candidatus Thiomargarita nelsonii TaxID=1003181 RepID=A0A176S0I5_9GAMM|nr:TPR repeat protein [Candidatus Thiomargarita nelsonii]
MINYINIKNFKSLKNIYLKPKNLNLCFGMNGMGKSSLLQALLLLRQSFFKGTLQETGLQFNLGVMYENGEGVTENNQEAVKWYRKAANQGYAGAQCNLGVMYAQGKGVGENKQEAIKWFRKAANQGLDRAQYNLKIITLIESYCPANEHRLTINANPPTSQIRIMNINPKYQPGICLKRGKYDVFVTHQGYESYRQWLKITDSNVSLDVTLMLK